jgi:hypothetical protein
VGEAEQGRRGEGREGAAASQRSGELQFRMALGDPRGEEGGDCQLGGGGEPRECGSVSLRATGPASLGGILHDQMLVLDECISDLNLLVLRERTCSVESRGRDPYGAAEFFFLRGSERFEYRVARRGRRAECRDAPQPGESLHMS